MHHEGLNGYKYLLFPQFITEEERLVLLGWAMRQTLDANTVSPHRYFRRYRQIEQLPLVEDLQQRVAKVIGVPYIEEPNLQTYLSRVERNGAIHRHLDPCSQGKHIRANIMIHKPVGGNPIIDDDEIDISYCDMWAFRPDEEWHSCVMVEDNGPRVVLSIGILGEGDGS